MSKIIILCISIILLYLFTQTLFFNQKPIEEIHQISFSKHNDIWVTNNNKNLLILLHGMYSSPETYKEVATTISKHGWDVFIPVLPNASLDPDELSQQTPYQWNDSIKVAFHRSLAHNKNYTQIALAGHSQGGSFALSIAPSLPFLSKLIIVAAPIRLIHSKNPLWKNLGIMLGGMLSIFIPKKGIFLKKNHHIERSKVENQQYDKEFLFGLTLHSMNLGLRKTRANLSEITIPTLLIYEQNDKVVPIEDEIYLKNNLSSTSVKEVILNVPKSIEPYSQRHRLFNYIYTKNDVANEIIAFLNND